MIGRITIYWLLSCCCLIACGKKNSTPMLKNHSKQRMVKTGKSSVGQQLKAHEHLPIEERIALYHRLKKESPDAYTFGYEDDLTMYGYSLLWNDKTEEALEVFKLIVSEFPHSSNPYDSVGEAYLKLGDKEKSLANYQKAVEIDPENLNALAQIDRILHPEKAKDNAPVNSSELFDQVFSAQAYQDDLNQLGQQLTSIHPNALKFISKEDFWQLINEKKALVTDRTTYAEFAWHCDEIIASIGCSHTSAGGFFREREMLPLALRFPLGVRHINGQLFVIENIGNEDKVVVKDEILSINGVGVAELIKDIYRHIPAQANIKTYKGHVFNTWAKTLMAYSLNFPGNYELIVKGKEKPIRLHPSQTKKSNFEEPFKQPCPAQLCLEIIDAKTAILTVASFNYYWWANLSEFKDFMDNSFREINKKGIKNLVIDVRFNGGGSAHSSIHLLKYLIDEPFVYYSNVPYDEEEGIQIPFENRYKGKLYFLIDGHGNSTTGHFMSIVKDRKLGTIVGEELGSNQFCTAGQKICKLSNTGMEFYVANSTCESSATSLPDEIGILPDHFVSQGIDDYLNNVDTVKEYVLGVIGG